MTSLRLATLALAAATLLVACGGDDPKPSATQPPIANVTAAPPPSTTAMPTMAGTFTAGPTARLDQLQGVVWQREGAGLLAYNRSEVQLIDASGAARNVFRAAAGETVIAVADTGFVSIQADRTITIRNVRVTTAPIKRIAPPDQFTSAVISPDGSLVALTLTDRIAVQLWDVEEQRMLRELTGFRTAAPVYSVRFGPDGRSLIWLSRAKVQVMDLASGDFSRPFEHEDFVGALALTADRSTLFTSAGASLTAWSVASGQINTRASRAPITAMALSPDDRTLAIATQMDGDSALPTRGVKLLDAFSLNETLTLPAKVPGGARLLAFSQDGRQLAVSDDAGLITLWRRP
jgi:WD40 repeat protein